MTLLFLSANLFSEMDFITSPSKSGFWNMEKSDLSKMILGECAKSSTFQLGCCENDNWYIQFYPQGCQLTSKGNVSIFLCRHCKCLQQLRYSFTLFYSACDPLKSRSCMKKTFDPDLVRWGYHQFGTSQRLFENSEKNIVLYYEIWRETETTDSRMDTSYMNNNDDSICISTNGCQIQVEKSILMESSEMISELVDKANCLNLEHVKPYVMKEIITFLHMGACPNFHQLGEELLAAASDLRIVKLKIYCEKELGKNLETKNVAMLLRLAANNNATLLKYNAFRFIVKNASAVCETEGWKVLTQSHPRLVAEAFEALAQKRFLDSQDAE